MARPRTVVVRKRRSPFWATAIGAGLALAAFGLMRRTPLGFGAALAGLAFFVRSARNGRKTSPPPTPTIQWDGDEEEVTESPVGEPAHSIH
jgi:hypothetical protein